MEELNLPDLMLARLRDKDGAPLGPGVSLQHDFLSGHLGAVTKKDQFERLKKFESTVIGKQDASERNVMQGEGAVGNLELKLKQVISYTNTYYI